MEKERRERNKERDVEVYIYICIYITRHNYSQHTGERGRHLCQRHREKER